MRIGLDFDGTIILYEEVFHRCAVERFHMPREIAVNKLAIRDWFWRTPAGKQEWIELQGIVYATRMDEAEMAPGLEQFLETCRHKAIHVSIISHRTEFPVIGPRVDLRERARQWLDRAGFHSRLGFRREDVFFESSREEKIRRIAAQQCSKFIDDLEEVFQEPTFPRNVEKLLYARGRRAASPASDIKLFSEWDAIRSYFLTVAT
jgi:hypothetical protein